MKWQLKPDEDTAGLREQLQAVEQPGSGLLRTMIMQDQKDPDLFCTLVVFESEEKARARERDPRRQEGPQVLRAMLADRLAGPPEFTDLAVAESGPGGGPVASSKGLVFEPARARGRQRGYESACRALSDQAGPAACRTVSWRDAAGKSNAPR